MTHMGFTGQICAQVLCNGATHILQYIQQRKTGGVQVQIAEKGSIGIQAVTVQTQASFGLLVLKHLYCLAHVRQHLYLHGDHAGPALQVCRGADGITELPAG